MPETVSTYDRLLVSVTLEKREGACALFVQKLKKCSIFLFGPETYMNSEFFYRHKKEYASQLFWCISEVIINAFPMD